jgi:isocitrate dehydrogenase
MNWPPRVAGRVVLEGQDCCPPGALVLKDRIADAMFQEVLIRLRTTT